MPRRMTVILALILALTITTAAVCADHSVLPAADELDETQALNRAVALLCAERGIDEADVRGHWYCYSVYYDASTWFEDSTEAFWEIILVDPQVSREGDGYRVHPAVRYRLDAATGEPITDSEENREGLEWEAWERSDPADWRYRYVPTTDQMQPAEALRRAQELLCEAIDCDMETVAALWRDYVLSGSTDHDGRFWYHVHLGYGGGLGTEHSPFTWHVYLDADTGAVVWQSDPARFAGRWAVRSSGQSWSNWYDEQRSLFEAAWGNPADWDYLQWLTFEEHCFGLPYWPEPHNGLPRADECSFEAACDAALAWLAEEDAENGATHSWQISGSAFYADTNNWTHTLLHRGVTENERKWSLIFVSDDPSPVRMLVYVDPATGEVTDGPRG